MFYRAQLSDNIALTPGLFVIFNPNHNADNNALIVGALRATFRF
jgi:carbohydrate-selective porin OprB